MFLGLAVRGCAGGKPAPEKQTIEPPPSPAAGGEKAAERLVEASVEEKNLLLKDRPEALEYLWAKLVGLLAERLVGMGFDPAGARKMTLAGRLADFDVAGHREKCAGKGAEEGKIIRAGEEQVAGELYAEIHPAE